MRFSPAHVTSSRQWLEELDAVKYRPDRFVEMVLSREPLFLKIETGAPISADFVEMFLSREPFFLKIETGALFSVGFVL